jgi:hypothetical protein
VLLMCDEWVLFVKRTDQAGWVARSQTTGSVRETGDWDGEHLNWLITASEAVALLLPGYDRSGRCCTLRDVRERRRRLPEGVCTAFPLPSGFCSSSGFWKGVGFRLVRSAWLAVI